MRLRIPYKSASLFSLVVLLIAGRVFGAEVQRVCNGMQPSNGIQTVELKELWRVGHDEGDMFFGRVPRVDTDRQGNIYIFDSQLCKVHVYSPDGDLLRSVFGEGDGPGEVRDARDMLLMPDGRIGLMHAGLGFVTFVEANGDPAGSFRLGNNDGCNYGLVSCGGVDGGVLLAGRCSVAGETPAIRNRRNFLVRSDLSGHETAAYAENHWVYNFNDFNYVEVNELPPFHWAFDVGPDGRVFTAIDRDKYEIRVFEADGTPSLIIERDYEPLARTDEDRARFTSLIKTSMEGMPFETKVEMEETYPTISCLQRGLQVRSDGTLWVLTARGMVSPKPGVMAVFDVFDSQGRFVKQVALVAPHEAARVGIVLAHGNRAIVIEGFLESLASQFGNGATFNGDTWNTPGVIVYEMAVVSSEH